MKIYKYEIPIEDEFILQIPFDGEILSFQNQNNIPMIWVLISESNGNEKRYFSIYGTGHEIIFNVPKKYIGTVQMNNGLVWHLFERTLYDKS